MLQGKKTYVTAVLAIATAIGAWFTGDATAFEAVQMGMTALLAAFVRNGVANIV